MGAGDPGQAWAGERAGVSIIYFIFGDVDRAPEKISELLSIIIKYLSHPHVIVITTADEEMFLEVIENNLDKEMVFECYHSESAVSLANIIREIDSAQA